VAGVLRVVGTPIGNLEDMSPRARRAIEQADVVAAEDTRAAERLCAGLGLQRRPVVSFFEGNEARRTEELIERLVGGATVALISEAGMPGVSDPGQRLVAAAVAAGVRVEVIPGPVAAVVALVASGLPTDRFMFVGFPPREQGARRELFGGLAATVGTMLFYEAPGRVGETLADLAGALGGARRAAVARELTKLHEEIVRGSLDELAARYADEAPRGECTIVVEGASVDEARARAAVDVEARVREMLAAGTSPKEIAARLALQTGKPKRQIYQLAIALRGRGGGGASGEDDEA
jgi:16S rRNA (cytidine1402-2'-O)-methyltransferase